MSLAVVVLVGRRLTLLEKMGSLFTFEMTLLEVVVLLGETLSSPPICTGVLVAFEIEVCRAASTFPSVMAALLELVAAAFAVSVILSVVIVAALLELVAASLALCVEEPDVAALLKPVAASSTARIVVKVLPVAAPPKPLKPPEPVLPSTATDTEVSIVSRPCPSPPVKTQDRVGTASTVIAVVTSTKLPVPGADRPIHSVVPPVTKNE